MTRTIEALSFVAVNGRPYITYRLESLRECAKRWNSSSYDDLLVSNKGREHWLAPNPAIICAYKWHAEKTKSEHEQAERNRVAPGDIIEVDGLRYRVELPRFNRDHVDLIKIEA